VKLRLLLALGSLLAVVLAFEAGRRYPFAILEDLLPRPSRSGAWTRMAPAELVRFEAASAAVGGRVYVFGGFYNWDIEATPRVDIWDPAGNEWTRRKDMPEAITHANGVVVGDTVWFAGGFIGDHPGPVTGQVRRYLAATDEWIAGPPLPEPRGGGALVLLDRRLHYFGGYGEDREQELRDHWVLALDELVWRPAAPLPVPRGHLAGIALNGHVYALGGASRHDPVQADLSDVHRYDPGTDRWEAVAPLPVARSHFEPGTFILDGRIVIVGGRSLASGRWSVADLTEYDPTMNAWLALPPLPKPLLAPIAVALGDTVVAGLGAEDRLNPRDPSLWITRLTRGWMAGVSAPVALGEVAGGVLGSRLLLVGEGSGATLAYDPGRDAWEAPDARAQRPVVGHHHAAEVLNGELYLLGGLGQNVPGVVQIYDPANDRWRFGPRLPFNVGSSASAVIDGRIYIAGGIEDGHTIGGTARFDPETETWTVLAPMPRPRNHAAAATDGRRMFVFGGRGPGSGDGNVVANGYDDVQIYDPATDTWTASGEGAEAPAPLPQARGGVGKAVYMNGLVYVMGGETLDGAGATGSGVYSRVDVYDPTADRWLEGPPMPTARHGIFPLALGARIYVVGGGTRAGFSSSGVTEILRTSRPPVQP